MTVFCCPVAYPIARDSFVLTGPSVAAGVATDAHAGEERPAVQVVEVALIQGCGPDSHQHAVRPDLRRVDVLELENLRRAVTGPDDRLHLDRLPGSALGRSERSVSTYLEIRVERLMFEGFRW